MTEITPETRVCALFGHPVGHSLSPAMHNAAFESLGLPFVYVAHDIAPERLPEAMAGVRALGYRGLSITIPHKVSSLSLVDDVDATARGIGCINTVVVEGSTLKGYNSDGRGALNALRTAGCDPEGARVVVLGSGGAARALALTLAIEAPPSELVVIGPEDAQRDQLVADSNGARHQLARGIRPDDSVLESALADTDLLLQCTPVGMHPDVNATLVKPEWLKPKTTVFDAVYNPRETRLLRDAKEAGCSVVPGLEMFLGQAIVQFELWTGESAPVDIMRRTLEERL